MRAICKSRPNQVELDQDEIKRKIRELNYDNRILLKKMKKLEDKFEYFELFALSKAYEANKEEISFLKSGIIK